MLWYVVLIVTCLFYYSSRRLRYFSSRGIATLPTTPFFGNLTAVTFGRENFVEAIAKGYDAFKDQRYFGLYQYLVPTLVPRDPELIRQILVRDFSAFADRGVHIDEECDPLFGRNLIMLRGKGDDENNSPNSTNAFTDDDLVAQAVLFYVAGYDTTANLINYFLYEMAVNPHVQEKLNQEIAEMSDEGDVYEAIQRLKYLEMCVCEVLRLWPLVGSADRRSVIPYDFGPTYPDSKHSLIAPAGIHIWIPIYSIHRDEQYWPDPNTCIPERFSPENKGSIVPYTYLPFGTGPRHCIGSRFAILAAKVFLVKFLKTYRTKTHREKTKLSPRAFILRPRDGFELTVERRIEDD